MKVNPFFKHSQRTGLASFTATDNYDSDVLLIHDALQVFPLGYILVTFRAEDDAGNYYIYKSSISVFFKDEQPPELTAPRRLN